MQRQGAVRSSQLYGRGLTCNIGRNLVLRTEVKSAASAHGLFWKMPPAHQFARSLSSSPSRRSVFGPWDEKQETLPKFPSFAKAKAEVENYMAEGRLDKASQLIYEVLDWLSRQKKARPDRAPEFYGQIIEALTMLAVIFGRRQNFTEALQAINKVLRMRRNTLESYRDFLGSRPRKSKTDPESTAEREKLKSQVKNLLDCTQSICVFADLMLQHYERLKLDTPEWDIRDESSRMLDVTEKELQSAIEILNSELLHSFLSSYPSDSLTVMSPFSGVMVSPTILKIETKQRILQSMVEVDLLMAKLHQQRKKFADAQGVLQNCMSLVEKELGSLAVESPLLAATFTGIADARLSLYLQGEAAQYGSSAVLASDEQPADGDEKSEGGSDMTSTGEEKKPAATFPRLSFAAKEAYLDEVDALLQKCINIFKQQEELPLFPQAEVQSLYLKGKLQAVRAQMLQDAMEMLALLLPDPDSIPAARRDQVLSQQATKIRGFAAKLAISREEGEALLKEAFQKKKTFHGTPFHHSVTECLVSLIAIITPQPSKRKEALLLASELYGHLDFLPEHNVITAQVLGTLAELKELEGDLQNAEILRKRSLESWKTARGPSHPLTLAAQRDLYNVYILQNRPVDAERGLLQLAKTWKKRLTQGIPVHNIMADIVHDIALLQQDQGKDQEMEKYLLFALKLLSEEEDDDSQNEEFFHKRISTGTVEYSLARNFFNRQQMEKALPLLKKSADQMEKKYTLLKKLPPDVRAMLENIKLEKQRQKESTRPAVSSDRSQSRPQPQQQQQQDKQDRHSKDESANNEDGAADEEEGEEEDEEEELTGLSKDVREQMTPSMKEEMKESIEMVRQTKLKEREKEANEPPSLELFESDEEVEEWDPLEEVLLKTLHSVVDLSLMSGDQPHLFETYAKKASDIAGEVYAWLEDKKLPRPSGIQTEEQVKEAATRLRGHLMSWGLVLQLLDRQKEAEFVLTRATILDNQYNLTPTPQVQKQEERPKAHKNNK